MRFASPILVLALFSPSVKVKTPQSLRQSRGGSAGFRSWFLLDTPVLETPSRVSIPTLVLCLSGLFVPSERFHGALVGVAMVLLLVVSILRLEAGAQ